MTDFPMMRGNARVARGASYFEVPLFSHIKNGLWTGCSPSEFPDRSEEQTDQDRLAELLGYHSTDGPVTCKWLMDGDKPRFDRILNLYPWGEYEIPEDVVRHTVEMFDSEDISDELDACAELVKTWLDEGHNVLVHCQAGLNRSALVAARTLMLYGMTSDEAINLLREKRSPIVLCNEDFEAHLRSLDASPS